MNKEEIVLYNKSLGIETIFSNDILTLGFSQNNTIYLNDNYQNLEQINRHEILHLYENTSQFKRIKEIIFKAFDSKELYTLRKEYYELYFPLYKNEENVFELIDNEILIDFIIKDREYIISVDDIIKNCFDTIINSSREINVNKRFLNISLSKKIDNQFSKLSKWEKIFVLNYYSNGLPTGNNKYELIRNDINKELEKLYDYANHYENFEIDYIDNKYLLREFNSEIEALKSRGETSLVKHALNNKEKLLQEMAKKFSNTLKEEYTHIVDFIKNSKYDNAFKYLMLNETLTKIYKQEKINDNSETIIAKREKNKSIHGHMILNETVLDSIYENLNNYSNFANLYYAGITIFNNKITKKSEVNIEGLDTFNKGKWIKFDGYMSDSKNYIDNSLRLSALAQETQWCTKSMASIHLRHGDFYVFVDNDNKPHVAVKMNGNEIDEVRGLKNGKAQEIEDYYRDVTLEFLNKNKDIKNGKEWLEKEEWNKRLVYWANKVNSNDISEDEMEILLNELFTFNDYKSHGKLNSNKETLLFEIANNKDFIRYIAKKYDCKEDEIFIGNINSRFNLHLQVVPYKVVLGNIDICGVSDINMNKLKIVFGDIHIVSSSVKDISNLEMVSGDLYFNRSKVSNLDNLKRVNGNFDLIENAVTNLDNLESVNGHFNLKWSDVISMKKLKFVNGDFEILANKMKSLNSLEGVKGNLSLCQCYIETFDSLKVIGGNLECERQTKLQSLKNLEVVYGSVRCGSSTLKEAPKLKRIYKDAGFVGSQIENLDSLQIVGGNAMFGETKLKGLPNLIKVGGWGDFYDSLIENLDNLEYIGAAADFRGSKLTKLPSLIKIKYTVDFSKTKIIELPKLEEFCDFKNHYPSLKLYLYIKKNFKYNRKNYRYVRRINENKR